jgi:hypothetical protein
MHGRSRCHNPALAGEFCPQHRSMGEAEQREIVRFLAWLDGLLDGSILFTGRDAVTD